MSSSSNNDMGYFPVLCNLWERNLFSRTAVSDGQEEFGSIQGRLVCICGAVGLGLLSPVVLTIFTVDSATKYTTEEITDEETQQKSKNPLNDEWQKSKGWAVLDIAAAILTSPILLVAMIVRYVIGIIHPGILMKHKTEVVPTPQGGGASLPDSPYTPRPPTVTDPNAGLYDT